MQSFILSFVELCDVLLCPSLQPTEVTLHGSTFTPLLPVLLRVWPIVEVMNAEVRLYWSCYRPLAMLLGSGLQLNLGPLITAL